MLTEAQYAQLQFDGMEDPAYIDAELLDIFASASIVERPEGNPSDAEYFFRIGGRVYEFFRSSEKGSVFELDGPGFRGDVYVQGEPKGEKDARRVCRIVLDYAAGRVEEGEFFKLDLMAA
ncbi:MAG: hypothetical protein QG623_473 [Patescibacteria group bacterium]|nr:hypothetical protein [Patescibacteria group bacterium]